MATTSTSIPGGLTFDEYLLVVQQQNSQGSQQPQAPVNPPHHYDVYSNPVYMPPFDPHQDIYFPPDNPYQVVSHQGPLIQAQPSGLQGQPLQGQPLVQQGQPFGPQGQPYVTHHFVTVPAIPKSHIGGLFL